MCPSAEKEARYLHVKWLSYDCWYVYFLSFWGWGNLHQWWRGRKRGEDSIPQSGCPGRSVSALNRRWVTLEVSFLPNSSMRSHFLPAIQITMIICTSSKPERRKTNGSHETPLPPPWRSTSIYGPMTDITNFLPGLTWPGKDMLDGIHSPFPESLQMQHSSRLLWLRLCHSCH